MSIWLLLLLIIIAGLLFFRYRSGRAEKHPSFTSGKSFPIPAGNKFHCVSIQFDDNACELIKALKNKRLLSSNLVGLPIQGCTAKKCNCRYVHYDDRRDVDRRMLNHVGQYSGHNTVSRQPRKKSDRRRD